MNREVRRASQSPDPPYDLRARQCRNQEFRLFSKSFPRSSEPPYVSENSRLLPGRSQPALLFSKEHRMGKKIITVLIIGVVGAVALAGTKAGSYIRSQLASIQDDMEDSIDPNVELKRIRYEIGQLDKDIDTVKGELAEANVNVRVLKKEVEDCRKDVELTEKSVRMHGDVIKAASENDRIKWGVRQVSYVEAKDLLFNEVKRHNDLKARLKLKEAGLVSQGANARPDQATFRRHGRATGRSHYRSERSRSGSSACSSRTGQ